jgi:hypothetical protein
LSAIVFILLSEIVKQHTASAFLFGCSIFDHGLDAGSIAFFAVFVDFTSELDTVLLLAFARIYNIRCLLARYVVKHATLGKHHQ